MNEIRKHDPDLPVAPSTESLELWKRFGPTIGYTPSNYVCGCGPIGGPGETRLTCDPFKVAVRNDQSGGTH